MSSYTSHPNINKFVHVWLEVQSEIYIECRNNGSQTNKMSEKEAFIKQQLKKLALKEIEHILFYEIIKFKIFAQPIK